MNSFLVWLVLYFVYKYAYTQSVVPKWPPQYQMNLSTLVQPCNETGYFNDDSVQKLAKFGIVSIDWSNDKQQWASAQPMDCQERLLTQAQTIKKINPSTKIWVYRNLIKALPWFTDVREKIVDPNYSGWFLKFKNNGPYNVPPCTNTTINGKTTDKCSSMYHDQGQTPKYPGLCHATCDCGISLPCGEYLWDHRNESLRQWLTDTFILKSANNSGLLNSAIDGFFLDDGWADTQQKPYGTSGCDRYNTFGGPSEIDYKCAQDMGLNADDVKAITNGFYNSTSMAENAIVNNNGFSWRLFYPGNGVGNVHPPTKDQCINNMRGSAKTYNNTNKTYRYQWTQELNMTQTQFEMDLAFFLLTRGHYAWLGWGWNGCHSTWEYQWFDLLDKDFGIPTEPYKEVITGVFQRKWSKCVVQIDCNQYKPSFNFTE
eukprot:498858_1